MFSEDPLTRYLLDRHEKSKYKKVSIFRPLQLCHWTFLAEVNSFRYIGQKPIFSFFGSSFWACSKKHAIFLFFLFFLIWKLHHLCKHTWWYYGCPGLLQRFLNGPFTIRAYFGPKRSKKFFFFSKPKFFFCIFFSTYFSIILNFSRHIVRKLVSHLPNITLSPCYICDRLLDQCPCCFIFASKTLNHPHYF